MSYHGSRSGIKSKLFSFDIKLNFGHLYASGKNTVGYLGVKSRSGMYLFRCRFCKLQMKELNLQYGFCCKYCEKFIPMI